VFIYSQLAPVRCDIRRSVFLLKLFLQFLYTSLKPLQYACATCIIYRNCILVICLLSVFDTRVELSSADLIFAPYVDTAGKRNDSASLSLISRSAESADSNLDRCSNCDYSPVTCLSLLTLYSCRLFDTFIHQIHGSENRKTKIDKQQCGTESSVTWTQYTEGHMTNAMWLQSRNLYPSVLVTWLLPSDKVSSVSVTASLAIYSLVLHVIVLAELTKMCSMVIISTCRL